MKWLFIIWPDLNRQEEAVDAMYVDIEAEDFFTIPEKKPQIGGHPVSVMQFELNMDGASLLIAPFTFHLDAFSARDLYEVLLARRPQPRFEIMGDPVPEYDDDLPEGAVH